MTRRPPDVPLTTAIVPPMEADDEARLFFGTLIAASLDDEQPTLSRRFCRLQGILVTRVGIEPTAL